MQKATPHLPTQTLSERWFLIDLSGKTPGRVAAKIAHILMGKDQASYNKAVDTKTHVIAINCAQVKFSGRKTADKAYYAHSGYPGSLKTRTVEQIIGGNHPEEVMEKAIFGMLPKNKLRNSMMSRLHLYGGGEHKHAPQQPVTIE